MNILFITYSFYPDFDANSLIINNIAQSFINKQHEVHALTLKSYPINKEEEFRDGIYIHRIKQSYDKKQILNYLLKYKFLSALRLTISILHNKFRKKEYLHSIWSYYSTKRMANIKERYDIDIIINVCYPFESCLPIIKYLKSNKKNFKWIIYMQDPFATQHYYLSKYSKPDLIDFQTNVFYMADKIIVTAPIANELKNNGNQIVIQKIKVLNFPIIEWMRRNLTTREEDVIFNKYYINCVYVGKFNEETRNPQVLFHLFEQLKYDKIRLHIIGENKEKWNVYLTEEDSNIFFYGPKSKEVSFNAELDSNILINLGNSVKNQLPSKLLEYISTGKPIVNLYKRGDCPTLEYMEKYPICLNIIENKNEFEENIWKLLYFCKRYKNININYNYIRNKYFDCTVEYVGNEFLNVCNELINEEEKEFS